MNDTLKKYLSSLNCSVINPIKKSLTDSETVGWYCKSTSMLRIDKHLELINAFIKKNNIPYYISEGNETAADFYIYINRDEK